MIIRPATKHEFQTAVEWAANEGWNPGLEDLDAFFAADPDGFLMGFEYGEPIASISVVRYGTDYGFLGFYIVRPDKRGTGSGLALWNAGLAHLKGRTVGLDGVVEQQANYEKSGFLRAGRNIRFAGQPSLPSVDFPSVRPVSEVDIGAILDWEKDLFPADRSTFLSSWLLANTETKTSLAAWDDDRLMGYGTIRKCREGYKIGPLFSDDEKTALALFTALSTIADEEAVILDVPEANEAAVELAKSAGLDPTFETARMYLGSPPKMNSQRQFGITTLELG